MLAAFLVGLTAPALAAYISGTEIYDKYVSSKPTDTYYCLAYITGSFDQLEDYEECECVPSNASVGQIKDVVIAYLQKFPQSRHFSAASLIRNSINYAFCKN